MKFCRASSEGYAWSLTAEEWRLLSQVLDLFPLIPPGHHQLSKTGDTPNLKADEIWLQESMSAHTKELRDTLDAILPSPPPAPRASRQRSSQTLLRLEVKPADLEKLLQVLNNIRVGSWIQLGCPDQQALADHESSSPQFLLAMEYCGWIQGHILEALADTDDPTPE